MKLKDKLTLIGGVVVSAAASITVLWWVWGLIAALVEVL